MKKDIRQKAKWQALNAIMHHLRLRLKWRILSRQALMRAVAGALAVAVALAAESAVWAGPVMPQAFYEARPVDAKPRRQSLYGAQHAKKGPGHSAVAFAAGLMPVREAERADAGWAANMEIDEKASWSPNLDSHGNEAVSDGRGKTIY